jgi:2-polyprenyl-6-methoxyphenol hydroxylase-like FAD-dependent oxidoreductase
MDTLHAFEPRYDAVIIGARCAGAATAMLLARAGRKVLVIDRSAYGSDTLSTHALMRTGVLQLKRWGLLPSVMAAGTPAIRKTTFHYGRESICVSIKPEHGVGHLCAPRRTVLDSILIDAARSAGADVRHGVTLCDLQRDADNRVIGAWLTSGDGKRSGVRCDVLIGADGRQSAVARLVEAESYAQTTGVSGCVYGYFENLDRDGSHWHFVENAAAGVIPTNDGQHCVFASVPRAAFNATFRGGVERAFLQVLQANSAELSKDVARSRRIGRLHGFAGVPGYIRQSHGPGWALVGDAGYFKDPLTAHGITDALRDAELLSCAIVDGSATALEAYQHQRDELSRLLFQITDSIASFRWSLDEVKDLHAQLSAAMRAEAEHMAGVAVPAQHAA